MRKALTIFTMIQLVVLVGCVSQYNVHIKAGTYRSITDETYTLGEVLVIEKITIVLTEINEDDFESANNINVIEDKSNNKYFNITVYIKEQGLDELTCEITYKPSTGGSSPNSYQMTLRYPREDYITIDLQLTLSDEGKNEFYLSMNVENGHVRPLLKLE